MQYLTTAVSLGATWKALKPHMPQLLAAVVLPLCCFNDEDEELWQDDPQEYIRKVCAPLQAPLLWLPTQRVALQLCTPAEACSPRALRHRCVCYG